MRCTNGGWRIELRWDIYEFDGGSSGLSRDDGEYAAGKSVLFER